MNRQAAAQLNRQDAGSSSESLYERVARAKHRWFKRVMSDRALGSTVKCFAYIVLDRLNCVTLDAWPGQPLIAQELGRKSIKTAHRVAFGLEKHGYLRVTRDDRGSYRYAPIFLPPDEDKGVSALRQTCRSRPDNNVDESSLRILSNLSSSTEERQSGSGRSSAARSNYDSRQRGTYEVELTKLLGNDGFEILARLSELNDTNVDRLCRAYTNGELDARVLIAARLAAQQLPKKRRSI